MPEEAEKNEGLDQSTGDNEQSQNTGNDSQEQDISVLPEWARERLTKAEEERDNYKKGLLSKKKEFNRTLETTQEEKKEEKQDDSNLDETEKTRRETLSQAEKIAEEKATKVLEKQNEDAAIEEFIEENPELNDPENWAKIVANYNPKSGRKTTKAILKDLKRALFIAKFEAGEIDGIAEEAEKNGERRGLAKAQLEDANTVSKGGSKKGTVSTESEIEKRLSGDLPPGF